MADERGGTKFAELITKLSLDKSEHDKGLDESVAAANSATLKIEKAFEKLGVRTDKSYADQKLAITTFYKKISEDGTRSATERAAAEEMLAKKIEALNNKQYSSLNSLRAAEKKAEEDSIKQRDQLWTNMGVRSNAQIEAQKKQVMDSYNQLKVGTEGHHRELLRLEHAKNEKLRQLDHEITGQREMSLAAFQRNILRLYATFYIFNQAAQTFIIPFIKGFKAVEEYNTAIASMAAMVMTFSENSKNLSLENQWKGALAYSTEIIPVLERIAAKTLLSGQETIALANAFARSGVFLDANNSKQIESFTRISNALPLMTQGQEITRQINTEIRSLMTGMNEQSSMMLITLKSIDPQIEKHLAQWRAEDTVLEHIGDLLKGFGPATEILEKQWKAVSTSIDTTANQILRGAMKPAYEDIIKLTQEFDKWLQENRKSITEILGLLIRVSSVGLGALIDNINTLFAPIRQFIALYDASMRKIEQWKQSSSGGVVLYWDNTTLSAQEKANSVVQKLIKQTDADILKKHKESVAEFDKVTSDQVAAFRNLATPPTDLFINAYIKKRNELKGENFKQEIKEELDAIEKAKKAEDERYLHNTELIAKLQEQTNKKNEADLEFFPKLSKEQENNYLDGIELINKLRAQNEVQTEKDIKWVTDSDKKIADEKIRTFEKADETLRRIMVDSDTFSTDSHEKAMKRIIAKEEEKAKIIQGLYEKGLISFQNAEDAKAKIAENKAKETQKLNSETFYKENSERQQLASNIASSFNTMAQLYAEDSRERQVLSAASKAATMAEIALQVQKNLMIAVGAVVNQGTGDPYSAFARIAAMIAVVSGVLSIAGMAFGSGSSASTTSPVFGQDTTVLGGENGQGSESIANSWELLQDTYDMQYHELSGIYSEMKDLNSNITGLVTSIVRTGGISFPNIETSEAINHFSSQLTWISENGSLYAGKLFNAIDKFLWGSEETFVSQTGLALGVNKTINDLLSGKGIGAQSYAKVTTEHGGGLLGGSDWTSAYYTYGQLNQNVTDMIDKVFVNMGQTIVSLAEGLGADVDKALNYIFIYSGYDLIDLQGKSAEQIDTALQEYFSAIGDTAVESLFGDILRGYQQVGEGMMETASRILVDKAIVLDTLDMTGQAFVGTAKEAIVLSESLINLAGDLETFQDSVSTYYDKFYSDTEKQTRLQEQLSSAMTSMNLVLPDTREGYRAVVEELTKYMDTAWGQEAYVKMLSMAESADQYYSVLEDINGSIEDTIDNLKSITQTITEWINNLAISDLAPVQSEAEWTRQYMEYKSKASASGATTENVSDYLNFASKYLEFQKSYGTATSYQAIYDAVVGDVSGIGEGKNAALEIAQQQLDALQAIKDNTSLDSGLAASLIKIAEQIAIDNAVVPEVPVTPTTPVSDSVSSDLAARQAVWQQAYDVELAKWNSIGDPWQTQFNMQMWAGNNPYPLYGNGGYSDTPAMFGERGGEWAVPTYQPQNKSFLKAVGADPETLGAAIGKYLQSTGGGSVDSSVIDNRIYIDGKEICRVVTKGMKVDSDLIESTRRAVN